MLSEEIRKRLKPRGVHSNEYGWKYFNGFRLNQKFNQSCAMGRNILNKTNLASNRNSTFHNSFTLKSQNNLESMSTSSRLSYEWWKVGPASSQIWDYQQGWNSKFIDDRRDRKLVGVASESSSHSTTFDFLFFSHKSARWSLLPNTSQNRMKLFTDFTHFSIFTFAVAFEST